MNFELINIYIYCYLIELYHIFNINTIYYINNNILNITTKSYQNLI